MFNKIEELKKPDMQLPGGYWHRWSMVYQFVFMPARSPLRMPVRNTAEEQFEDV